MTLPRQSLNIAIQLPFSSGRQTTENMFERLAQYMQTTVANDHIGINQRAHLGPWTKVP